ncbi:TetR/AcrR family transcriptional regulator [Actinocrispum sp. NPDC049592]|uniref:TetR/AcrR family transcriptional regulator n=1 Tax=Actinocrispum sp. NPDC049592 TaxID=3154835 RepID=UPI003412D02E
MEQTRERIVRAAAKLFLTRSYHAVGIADLCAAADVRKGSFYHFFPSKADLAKAVIDLHAAEFDKQLTAAQDEGLYAVAVAVTQVQGRFEERFGRIVGCPFGNLAAELSTTDDELRAHVADVFARWEQRLLAACRRYDVPDETARMILAQIQGLILLAKVQQRPAAEITAGLRTLIAGVTA